MEHIYGGWEPSKIVAIWRYLEQAFCVKFRLLYSRLNIDKDPPSDWG